MIDIGLVALTSTFDSRGLLTAAQHPDQIPFIPQRLFLISGSPRGTIRGGHAHKECHQLLIRTSGSIAVELDGLHSTRFVVLRESTEALYIPPLVWAQQTYLTEGASLAVLASHPYDATDYIDDRTEAALIRAASK